MRYLLDTNILLLYLREDSIATKLETQYRILETENLALISVVSKGELRALALKNKWGNRRIAQLEEFLNQFFIIDIISLLEIWVKMIFGLLQQPRLQKLNLLRRIKIFNT